MSNFFLGDRIKETSRVQGTNDISLDGAAAGFSSFSDFYASGDTVFYAITDNNKYEVGSGIYKMSGTTRVITRHPFRSSEINAGPWYVNGTSNSGPSNGQTGHFHPLWLTKSAAISGVGFADGPFTAVSGLTFDEHPGVTFYQITEHSGQALPTPVDISGANYAVSGQPVNFGIGLKEVFITYPGKTAVYQGFGLESNTKEPKVSGISFWANEQILNYSSSLVFNDEKGYVGVGQSSPEYAIDVAGNRDNTGAIRASGFVAGGSGIMFSGGQLTDVNLTASGGRQYEPFRRNRIGTASNGVVALSGIVNEIIDFEKQSAATVFAGPPSGSCDPCPNELPTFRQLEAADMPHDLGSSFGFVNQKDQGLDGTSINTATSPFLNGLVAIYAGSGFITYDSGIYFDAANNRLQIGGDPNILTPQQSLHVRDGNVIADSGYFKQLIFTDSNYRLGELTGTDDNVLVENFANIFFGANAGQGSSGNFDSVFVGKIAGYSADEASGVVALGRNAFASGNLSNHSIFVGEKAGQLSSGIDFSVALGYWAGLETKEVLDSVAIGNNSAYQLKESNNVIALGVNSAYQASGLSTVLALGNHSTAVSSGLVISDLIGQHSASGSFDFYRTFGVGDHAAAEASGLANTVALGQSAARYAETLDNVVALGRFAALSGLELERTVALGALAASSASGSFNVYIGQDAGIAVSGHENIEIIASGQNASFLTHEASGKINIGSAIVGDIYHSRVAVGKPDDASPSGTLFIRPKDADELALVVQHQGSGSSTPYVALKSGDATTFYQITNSGDVITSGCMKPSGGLLLPQITPANWMNSTANRLYNDAGTLKWNGASVATGGGMAHFDLRAQFDDTADSGVEISNDQTILFSGIHGVDTLIDSGNRQIIVDVKPLSGILQSQITASQFAFKTVSSGNELGANNHVPFLSEQTDVTVPPIIVFSGISGINIDSEQRSDGLGNNSGIHIFGLSTETAFSFKLRDQIAGVNGAQDTIVNDDVISVSGASGIITRWDATDNVLRIGASGLSGVLYDTIINSGAYLRGQILENTTSGVAISGIGTWASGEFGRLGLAGNYATSGLIKQGSAYIMDPDGSGVSSHLRFTGSRGNVVIQVSSGDAVGVANYYAGTTVEGNGLHKSVVIGSGAGTSNRKGNPSLLFPTGVNEVYIGNAAGADAHDRSEFNVFVGENVASGHRGIFKNAVYSTSVGGPDVFLKDSVAIGREALREFKGGSHRTAGHGITAIGQLAMAFASGDADGTVAIGVKAGELASGAKPVVGDEQTFQNNVFIGKQAGQQSMVLHDCVAIGSQAGSGAWSGRDHSTGSSTFTDTSYTFIGKNSGKAFKNDGDRGDVIAIGSNSAFEGDAIDGVFIGQRAGYQASGQCDEIVAIGYAAAEQSYRIQNAVAIGFNAGYKASGDFNTDPSDQQTYTNFTAIGPNAARESHQLDHSVVIGPFAGYKMKGNKNSIIISNRGTVPSDRDANWSAHGVTSVLDIGHAIQGLVQTADSSNQVVNLHIGKPLQAASTETDDSVASSIRDSVLNITSDVETDSLIRLKIASDVYGTSDNISVIPSESLFVSETWSDRNNSTGAAATEYKNSTKNPIVNKHGYLTLPIATSKIGSGSSLQLKDARGAVISKLDGTICILDDALLNVIKTDLLGLGASTSAKFSLAFCMDSKWHLLPDTTELS